MAVVSVQQAEENLSQLVERAATGEEIVLTESGRPVAKIVAVAAEPRRPGRLKGRIRIADDFDAPLPESIAKPFRGESD